MFEQVREALTAGLTFYKSYSQYHSDKVPVPKGQGHAMVDYNAACIWSLMAESLAQASCRCEHVIKIDRHAGIDDEPETVRQICRGI